MTSAQDLLSTLPVDILIDILSLLDPVSLIAVSQTSQVLRNFVNPVEHDFEQRLLALELLPEHGGPEPVKDDLGSTLPHLPISCLKNRGEEWWGNNKYACCECMKILPNFMFEDEDLFDPGTRKPWSTSAETQKMALTDWKFVTATETRWSLIKEQVARDAKVTEQYQQQFRKARNRFRENFFGTRSLEDDDEVRIAAVAEMDKCKKLLEEAAVHMVGKARHKRRCIECKFQRKRFHNYQRLCGHPDAPIVTCSDSTGLPFEFTSLFPGLFPKVPLPPFDRDWRCSEYSIENTNPREWVYEIPGVQNHGDDYEQVQLHRIRCPTCEKWQQSRAFGMTVAGPDDMWRFLQLDQTSPLCHYCHVKAHGKAATAARVYQAAMDMINSDITRHLFKIKRQWNAGLGAIHRSLLRRGQEEIWERLAVLNGNPDGQPLETSLDWSAPGFSPAPGWMKTITPGCLPTLQARKRLIVQTFSDWRDFLRKVLADLHEANDEVDSDASGDDVESRVSDDEEESNASGDEEESDAWDDEGESDHLIEDLEFRLMRGSESYKVMREPESYKVMRGVKSLWKYDMFEVIHQSVMHMATARDRISEAKANGDHDLLLSLLVQDEYGRNLTE